MLTLLEREPEAFPKYVTQLLNLANQNAQGTRPKVVGQQTELIQQFPGRTLDEWEAWYQEQYPDAIQEAAARIYRMVEQLRQAIAQIDGPMVERWVRDLVLTKTYIGLRVQEAILRKVAEVKDTPYRAATTEEEARGIDGFIGETPVSIKPETYRAMGPLPETIPVTVIYYSKQKDGLALEFDF
jgi:hypothetical protein